VNWKHLPKPLSFYPYKGFHVGITGQAEFINKPSYVALTGSDPAPKGRWTTGWETGIEFSYHFAKYSGISLGINYGTMLSYIHTFNWEKTKRYIKKQEYSFSSKKERRKKIIDLLNAW
jgi:hypothetical protein